MSSPNSSSHTLQRNTALRVEDSESQNETSEGEEEYVDVWGTDSAQSPEPQRRQRQHTGADSQETQMTESQDAEVELALLKPSVSLSFDFNAVLQEWHDHDEKDQEQEENEMEEKFEINDNAEEEDEEEKRGKIEKLQKDEKIPIPNIKESSKGNGQKEVGRCKRQNTAGIYHEKCLEHLVPEDHYELPQRLTIAIDVPFHFPKPNKELALA